jgi:hypothetical protein
MISSFFDELLKISASKEEKKVPAKKPNIAARAMGGMMGAGMAYSQAPILKSKLMGRDMFYHGTAPEAAEAILGSQGIDPAFAGAGTTLSNRVVGDKAARINRYLMADSLNRMLESHGVPLTHEQMSGITDQFNHLMDNQGLRAGEAAQHIYKGVTDDLIRAGKLTPEAASTIGQKLRPELSQHGQRVYFASHPSAALPWASNKGEGQMAMEAMSNLAERQSKQGILSAQARNMGEALTFGLPSTVSDIRNRMQYKPTSEEHMTLGDVHKELGHISQEHASGSPKHVVFGAEVPTGQLGYMEDFPVAKHFVGVNPGLKPSLRDVGFQTYEPGRDISFPHLVPKEHIQHVDIVDPTTNAIRRIHVSDAKRAVKSPLLKRMRGVMAPAALTGLGAYSLYRAFKPKKRMVPESSPLAEKVKKGSVGSDVWRVGKYLLPIGALGTGVGLASSKLMDKALPDRKVEGSMVSAAKSQGRQLGGTYLGLLGSSGLGALAAVPILSRTGLDIKKRLMLGAAAGGIGGSLAAAPAAVGREMSKTPEADPYSSVLPEKNQDTIRKHPWIGGVRNAALGVGLPLAGLYAFRKYYPGTYSRLHLAATKGLKELSA